MTGQSGQSFALVISGAPYASQAPQTALNFAQAAINAGHRVDHVFLYGNGVHLASSLACPPADESDWPTLWRDFLNENQITATCCVASALRRGLLDEGEAKRYERDAINISSPFVIAGLGEWVEAVHAASRTLYFNGGG